MSYFHSEPQSTPAFLGGFSISLGRFLDLLGELWGQITLTWPNSHMYLPPKSTAAKARRVSVVGTLTGYSDIPKMQDLPSRLQGFNPWLAQLHGDSSSPSSVTLPLGSAWILAPT